MVLSIPKPSGVTQSVLPQDLVGFAASRSLEDFLAAYSGAAFLLVKLDDPTGEIEAALRSADVTRVKPNLNVLGFHTVVADMSTHMPAGTGAQLSVNDIRRRLAKTSHYAITLDKRVHDGTYVDRISIGRARNKDIVLRHPSVSKFHAWFERDEAGTYYVADAGSKNGTRINQDEGTPRELTKVAIGDTVRFGSVETVICASETLWKALRDG
ncbi:MAG TPA: FHA domain-containing protein [Polyangiales bacterium]